MQFQLRSLFILTAVCALLMALGMYVPQVALLLFILLVPCLIGFAGAFFCIVFISVSEIVIQSIVSVKARRRKSKAG